MKPREIILANIAHDDPARPGMTFGGGRMNDLLWAGPTSPGGWTPTRWVEGSIEYYDDEWGNVWRRMVAGSAKGEVWKPVLDDWSKLDTMEVPHYEDPACYEGMRRVFSQSTDLFKMAGVGGWIFDNARYLRTMEVYFTDMVLYPEELKRLHAKVAGLYEARIHGAGKSGADGIMIGEDLGTQNGLLFSPAMFREYFKPEYTRLVGIAHDYGMKVFLHSCGYNWEIMDDLIEIGIDCFQFDQPARYDMPALASKLREHKAALWSPVDIQTVLPTGDRNLIEAETAKMLKIFRGGLILKDYPDLPGIGVKPEWDQWAYDRIMAEIGRG